MKKSTKIAKTVVALVCTGSMMFQVAGCSTTNVRTQMARGLTTMLNGLWGIGTTQFANQVFDIDN